MQRYHRQVILPQVGAEGQRKLFKSKVLLIGAGGLGHPVAQYLAAMGIGQIRIVDGDSVHLTNLHRQILFTERDIGKNKAEVLAEKICQMNPATEVSYESVFLDKALALKIFRDFDLVMDCTDNFESKFLINDVCSLYEKPMVHGAISQFEGQVGVFLGSKGACYRCLYPDIPKSRIQTCAESGVVGAVVGIIGSLQSLEAMKVLIGNDVELMPLIGRVNFYDFCSHSFRTLQVPPRSFCPCHKPEFSSEQVAEINRSNCSFEPEMMLVDVREIDEWNEYHVEGSVCCPLSELEGGGMPNLPKDRKIVLICKGGGRAIKAREILKTLMYVNVQCSDRSVYEY